MKTLIGLIIVLIIICVVLFFILWWNSGISWIAKVLFYFEYLVILAGFGYLGHVYISSYFFENKVIRVIVTCFIALASTGLYGLIIWFCFDSLPPVFWIINVIVSLFLAILVIGCILAVSLHVNYDLNWHDFFNQFYEKLPLVQNKLSNKILLWSIYLVILAALTTYISFMRYWILDDF
ncbi:hypothetical protein MFERI14815_00705 [Mycoplasma feriruminatoris]|uniref:Uncharacterized protein n=1 Tax=Mycoplasma feriruminatoris TaxID=1179777 RepID=A0AAQ3DNS8_9MOLU|nr:putative membrane protein [Mycoplasma feriruminatoris]WFQ92088.1 hypothetical protein MFERI14815_00705 [Mycoplasma feriruminatoris]WFQ93778.1 hypothetical protein MFERI15181_00699 [Mycoplasma feriruminatoris]WFQ94614.1 hypothetical protein MFERI15220_00696 [Mycoplasma feriruminatoris]WFQ95438.1 hypothetical protein MFERI15407_00699 [Mycoplasma feriruminatoris]